MAGALPRPERLERLRAAAEECFRAGVTAPEAARRLGVARSTAYAWRRRWQAAGALVAGRRGPRRRLPQAGALRLCAALLAAPGRAGLPLEAWSLPAIAWWLERETGVRYHRRHVGRLLRALGWTRPPVGPRAGAARVALEASDPQGSPLTFWLRPDPLRGEPPGGPARTRPRPAASRAATARRGSRRAARRRAGP